MQRETVQSSLVRSVAYDPETTTLEVEFHHGQVWQYFDVPDFLYRGFMLATSKGTFFNRRIQTRFKSERIR